jgi:hypothetical protein
MVVVKLYVQAGTHPLGHLEEHLMSLGIVLLGWLGAMEARGVRISVMKDKGEACNHAKRYQNTEFTT